jgi:CRISPR/Cas system-associated endonuclease Cas1
VKTLLDFANVFREQIVERKIWRGISENETPGGFTLHIMSYELFATWQLVR